MGGLKEFLSNDDGHGYGSGHSDGCGHGDGDGSGYGDGSGHGRGDGCGHGHGYCGGYGYADGSGHGDGDVSGKGTGSGSGYGDGADSRYSCGIKSINGFPVYVIDGVYTVIYQLHGDIAKGAIADVAPVVHGSWVKNNDSFQTDDYYCCYFDYSCSECGEIVNDRYKLPNYCPNCGARMDGGDNDDA